MAEAKTPPNQPPATTAYRYIGPHATILEAGTPVAPGEVINLTSDEMTGHNQDLLDEGALIYVPDTGTQATTAGKEDKA